MIIRTGIGALADGRDRHYCRSPFCKAHVRRALARCRFEPGWQVCQASGRSGLHERSARHESAGSAGRRAHLPAASASCDLPLIMGSPACLQLSLLSMLMHIIRRNMP